MGSLVASRYVLTAAHCVESFTKVEVLLGYKSSYFSPKLVEASTVRIHDDYPVLKEFVDVALVELQEDLDIMKYVPICLPDREDATFQNMSLPKITLFDEDNRRILKTTIHRVVSDSIYGIVTEPTGKKVSKVEFVIQ